MQYQKEIDYIRQNYNVTQNDEALLREIDLFMEHIKDLYDYDFHKHIGALVDVIINRCNVGEDGLTPYARKVLGSPKMKILDWSRYGL